MPPQRDLQRLAPLLAASLLSCGQTDNTSGPDEDLRWPVGEPPLVNLTNTGIYRVRVEVVRDECQPSLRDIIERSPNGTFEHKTYGGHIFPSAYSHTGVLFNPIRTHPRQLPHDPLQSPKYGLNLGKSQLERYLSQLRNENLYTLEFERGLGTVQPMNVPSIFCTESTQSLIFALQNLTLSAIIYNEQKFQIKLNSSWVTPLTCPQAAIPFNTIPEAPCEEEYIYHYEFISACPTGRVAIYNRAEHEVHEHNGYLYYNFPEAEADSCLPVIPYDEAQ